MTRITPDYAALNRELHAKGNYGAGGGRWTLNVLELMQDHACETVLDYGCGQGRLRAALGPEIREYDPAILGKNAEPEPADLVVCTDVLEHIEPDCLDAVLDHLKSLTKKRLLLNIATRSAKKTLADGRNAHLIVETSYWWRERLEKRFRLAEWKVREGEVFGIAVPLQEVGEIETKGALDDETRYEYAKANCARFTGRVAPADGDNGRTAILVCYGPSLTETWPHIQREVGDSADVISVSGAHDYLTARDIAPDFHIECDPRAHKGGMVTPLVSTVYLMASCCHPDTMAKLGVGSVKLWHLCNGEPDWRILNELDPGSFLVAGGGSVGVRAVALLWIMGYRKFVIHGMDCSFRGDEHHAAHHTGKPILGRMRVRCGERWFDTSGVFITYARQFFKTIEQLEGIDVELHGDGLLQHMARLRSAPQPE